jgi:hypothetical protein
MYLRIWPSTSPGGAKFSISVDERDAPLLRTCQQAAAENTKSQRGTIVLNILYSLGAHKASDPVRCGAGVGGGVALGNHIALQLPERRKQ